MWSTEVSAGMFPWMVRVLLIGLGVLLPIWGASELVVHRDRVVEALGRKLPISAESLKRNGSQKGQVAS